MAPPLGVIDPPPKTAILTLFTFAELYRPEVGAEEDVHRTLPLSGTALGLVIGAVAFPGGRLPKWTDLPARRGMAVFILAIFLLVLSIEPSSDMLLADKSAQPGWQAPIKGAWHRPLPPPKQP